MPNSCPVSKFSELKRFKTAFMYLGVFTIAVVAALVQNFCVPNTRTALMYDSESYLLTTTWVGVFLSSLLHLHPKLSFVTAPLNYSEILLDGPAFPLINALIFLPFHHVPAPFEWKWLLVVQSFWLGISSCLCSYLTAKITKNKLYSCAAGLVWAFYPGALISTQRFLTEPLAATLLLSCASFLCAQNPRPMRSVLAGILAGLLALTKAALLPVSFALAAVTAMFVVRKRIFVFAFLLGVVCMLVPWALYTKMVGGTMFFTPQRYTSYNFTLGYDVESDGWCTIPHSPYQKLFENSGADFTTPLAQWKQHPAQCVQLTLRKLSRLYAQPWNDFRHSALGLGPAFQCGYHIALLCLTAFAMLFFIIMRRSAASVDEKLGVWLCTTAFLGHLIYLPFESLNRYSFTGMPYACILAIYSIWALVQQTKTDKSPLTFLKIASITATAGLIVFCAQNVEAFSHADYGRSSKELQIALTPGQSIATDLDLSSLKLPDHFDAYILIDGDHNVCNTHLRFNGHAITSPIRPSFYFDSSRYAISDLLERFSTDRNTGIHGFRQWYMVAIPSAWVDRKANEIDLEAGPSGCFVYGDSSATRNLPDLNSFVPDYIANYFDHYDPRTTSFCFTAASKSKSWLALSGAATESPKELACVPRIKLLLAIPSMHSIPAGSAPAVVGNTTQTGTSINSGGRILLNKVLEPSQFDPLLTYDAGPGLIRVNSTVVQPARTTGIRIPLPEIPNTEHLHILLTGMAHKNSNNGIFGIEVAIRGDDALGAPLMPANIPRSESAGSGWTSFTIDSIVPVASIASGKRFLEITFFPGLWMDIATHGRNNNSSDVSIKDVHLKLSTCYFPDVAGKRIIIY
jgi:hypothetical protein